MSSLHPSASEIIKSGIFNNVKNFNEFKQRVSKTTSLNNRGVDKTKGDIFEIFCEAFLTVNKEYQIKKVYPQEATPVAIRKKLGLPPRDDGWDGVYETLDGKFATWQAKFRSNNERLLWQGDNGLSSTVAKGQRADIIHLITTVTKIPPSFTNSDKILETLGNRLGTMEPAYFSKIEKWLNKKKFETEGLHEPDDYQIEALESIEEEFKKNNRTTVVMACGSGKTDIGVWEYQRQKPKLALVLVPSIALVKQIRADWLSQMTHNVVTFQLCSSKDTSKKEDCLVVREKELDMKISTNSKELKLWTEKHRKEFKIIFSTYQSSEVMNSALKGKVIDFAVFDEAHRTAVVNKKLDSYYSNALFDKNIKIKKRLFMTATRKVARSNNTNRYGDIKLDVNMDNSEIYGNVCYKLSFTKAAKEFGCIAKLKIIVSEIFSDEIDIERAKISSTHVDGEKLKSEYLANIIAIKRAIEKFKIKKAFSFHSMIGAAREFTTSEGPVNIGYHLDKFYTNFIEGKMGMKKRDEIMKEFDDSSKSLIGNKRCLIEGVDVPAVNMVVFNNPKESVVDIVQAIGRALRNRKDSKKKYGYVLVPIFIDRKRNESHEDAIARSNFEKVTEVINAVKQHDDEIAQIIQELSISSSRGKGITKEVKNNLDDFIEIYHPEISKSVLFKSIASKIIDRFQTAWEIRVGELINFKKEFGHLKVPSSPRYKNLAKWCQHIRKRWFDNKLLEFQITKLIEIGFLKYPEGVTIFEKKDLLTLPELAKKTGATKNILNKLIEAGEIKSEGKIYGTSKEQTAEVYKPYTSDELKKILNVDYFTKRNHETIYTLERKLKVSASIIEKYLSIKKIKSIGNVFYSEVGKSLKLYKRIKVSKKHIYKTLGYILEDKNVVNIDKLNKHLMKITKSNTSLKWFIEDSNRKGIIKPKGYVVSKSGSRVVFEKYTLEEFKKITGITIFNKEKLYTLNSLSSKKKISIDKLKKLIEDGKLKSVGKGLSNSGITDFYKITDDELKNLLGVDILDTSNLFSILDFEKKFGIMSSVVIKLFKLANIKAEGTGVVYAHKGVTDYYKNISIEELKEKSGVRFIQKKDKKNLVNLKNINDVIKKTLGFKKNYESLKDVLTKNNINPVGKGISNSPEPIDFYKPIPKTMIKKIFKND